MWAGSFSPRGEHGDYDHRGDGQGVYGTGTGRSRPGKVRRDGGRDDCATQVRQRDPVLPLGATRRSDGDSLTGSDAMGGGPGGGRVTQTGARRVDPAGGAGRGGT